MQRKKNTGLKNEHHAIIGMSGSMKSTWLNRHKPLLKAVRIIAWDPDHDHIDALQLQAFDSLQDLLEAIIAAGAGPLRVAFSGTPTRRNFELFLKILRASASADRVTFALIEEMSSVVPPQWQNDDWIWLWTGSRKYGLKVYGVTHSPLSVDKQAFRGARFKWFGGLEDDADIAKVAKIAAVPAKDVQAWVQVDPAGKFSRYLYGSRGQYKQETIRY